MSVLTSDELNAALVLRDLSDPAQGPHAIQLVVDQIRTALGHTWPYTEIWTRRDHPVVSLADNYDNLGYAAGAVTREARYTRYASEGDVLRSHTSAMIPPALRELAELHRVRRTDGVRGDLLPAGLRRLAAHRYAASAGPVADQPQRHARGARARGDDRPAGRHRAARPDLSHGAGRSSVHDPRPADRCPARRPVDRDRGVRCRGAAGTPQGRARRELDRDSRWVPGSTDCSCCARESATSGCSGQRIRELPRRCSI